MKVNMAFTGKHTHALKYYARNYIMWKTKMLKSSSPLTFKMLMGNVFPPGS
jgi:hypothetical protein